jgi:hypothetical protein
MEYISMSEAARRSGLSTKTLQRAIKAGELHEAQRLQDNQARIAVDELKRWLAARQSTEVQATQPTSVNDPSLESRIDQLERQLRVQSATINTMQFESMRGHNILVDKINALEKRIVELTTALQDAQDMVIKLSNPAVPAQPAQKETSTPAPVQADETTFDLADFTQLMQHEYRSSATRGDVKAWFTLRPEPQGVPGDYKIDYFKYDRADGKKGQMGKDQAARGEQLKSDLRAKVSWAAIQAGWTKGPHDIFVCPVDQGKS